MASNSREVEILLRLEDRLSRQLGQANRRLDRFERSARQAGRTVQDMGNRVNGLARGLRALAGIGVAIAGANALGGAVRDLAQLQREAETIGTTVERLSALQAVFRQMGVESEQSSELIRELNNRLGEAATDGGEVGEVFERLGLQLRDANGDVRNAAEILPEVFDAVAQLRTQADRTFAVDTIFGDQGTEALALMQRGADGLSESLQQVERDGAVVSREQTEAAIRIEQAYQRLVSALRPAFGDLVGLVAENVEASLGSIRRLIREIRRRLPSLTEAIRDVFSADADTRRAAVDRLETLAIALRNVVKAAVMGVGQVFGTALFEVIANGLREILPSVMAVIRDSLAEADPTGLIAGSPQSRARESSATLAEAQQRLANLRERREGQPTTGRGARATILSIEQAEADVAAARENLADANQAIAADLIRARSGIQLSTEFTEQAATDAAQQLDDAMQQVRSAFEAFEPQDLPDIDSGAPPKTIGDEADALGQELGSGLADAITQSGALAELRRTVTADLNRQLLEAQGRDREAARVELLEQQAEQVRQLERAYADYGGVTEGVRDKLGELHRLQLQQLDAQADATEIQDALTAAERAYREQVKTTADALAAGNLTREQAAKLNREAAATLVVEIDGLLDRLADLQQRAPQLAASFEPLIADLRDARRNAEQVGPERAQGGFGAGFSEGVEQVREANAVFAQGQKLANGVANSIGGNLTDAIMSAAAGAQGLSESFRTAAASILSDISRMIVRMLVFRSISAALGGLFAGGGLSADGGLFPGGDIGARATGGPVQAGQPYLVGERGPELMVPGVSGGIVPAQRLAQAMEAMLTPSRPQPSSAPARSTQSNAPNDAVGPQVLPVLVAGPGAAEPILNGDPESVIAFMGRHRAAINGALGR